MTAGVLGIPDPWIWIAYLLCLASAALCVVHAALRGREFDRESSTAADAKWAQREKEVEEEG